MIRKGESEEGRRVLIVDDDADLAESLAEILLSRDYEVATAEGPETALEALEYFPAEVALIDVRLGRASGIELMGRLRARRPGLLCVLMTAYADTESAIEALHRDAYQYLRKPLAVSELLATMSRCRERLRLAREKEHAEEALRSRNRELEELNLQLREARDTLEQRVAERTAALRSANQELRTFAYTVSHEMRVALVNLRGFLRELCLGLESVEAAAGDLDAGGAGGGEALRAPLRQDIPEALSFIESSVEKFEHLTEAILRLARLGHRELSPEPVAVGDVVRQLLESLSPRIEEKGAEVSLETLPTVVADPISLELILGNLLSNAVAYLEPGRPGKIRVSGEEGKGETILHVRDNGRGIAAHELGRVFDLFYRAGKQDVEGEGLGLTYARTLVQHHGGRIWCESEAGAGATFSFSLPQSPEEPIPEEGGGMAEAGVRRGPEARR